jgi:hypothetical protein
MEHLLKYAEPAIIVAVDHLVELVDRVTARVSQASERRFLPPAARAGITTGLTRRASGAAYPYATP